MNFKLFIFFYNKGELIAKDELFAKEVVWEDLWLRSPGDNFLSTSVSEEDCYFNLACQMDSGPKFI